jgi:hypothetical protein
MCVCVCVCVVCVCVCVCVCVVLGTLDIQRSPDLRRDVGIRAQERIKCLYLILKGRNRGVLEISSHGQI